MTTQLTVVPTTMTSREIAELTGKTHAHVLRDIDSLLESLNPDLGLGFQSSTYKDATGKENRMFIMDRDSSYCLVAGYDANARMRIIKRWQELETRTALPHNPLSSSAPKAIEEAFSSCLNIARLCGFEGNMALLSADTGTKTLTGISALSLIGATHLLADQRGRTYTPTELGKMCDPSMTAVKFNLALEAVGLQKRDMGEWMPTDKAASLCEWLDTGKRHSNGTPVKQLKWFKAVLENLTRSEQKEAA